MANWLWINLPVPWKLQDVQAGLNVVVTVLCAMCIFVFSRWCWQTATAEIVKKRPVPLPALLSVTSLGEVYDIVRLLGWTLLTSGYLRILAQCLIVIGFAAGAILSGPIARFSTTRGHTVNIINTPGVMTERNFLALAYSSVLWNATEDRLNAAGFPRDQLLDFLPNSSIPWQYNPREWNSSWSMECEKTERTPITLAVTNRNCSYAAFPAQQIPALVPVFNGQDFSDANTSAWSMNWESRTLGKFLHVDILWFLTGWKILPRDEDHISPSVKVTTVSLHMKNATAVTSANITEKYCQFGAGPIKSATYIKTVCTINRKSEANTPSGYNREWTAMPDVTNPDFHVQAYTSYYQARFDQEGILGHNVTELTPDDLIRFYQVYQVTKDTQDQTVAYRNLTVQLDIIQISTIFVIVCGFLSLLCLIGLVRFSHFWVRHWNTADQTPLSKLDWMLHTVEQTRPADPYNRRNPRYSVHSLRQDSGSSYFSPKDESKKADFEAATYGMPGGFYSEPQPYHNSWVASPGSASSPGSGYELVNSPPGYTSGVAAVPLQIPTQNQSGHWDRSNWDAHSADSVSLLGNRQPTAPMDPLFNNHWPQRS